VLRETLESIKLELENTRAVWKELLAFFLSLAATVAAQRMLIHYSSGRITGQTEIFTVILLNNTLALLILAFAMHIILHQAPRIAQKRCRQVQLWDCRYWTRLPRSPRLRLLTVLALGPIILTLITYNSLHTTPHGDIDLIHQVILSLRHVYGALEYTGYMLGMASQAPNDRKTRTAILAAGLTALVLAAKIEAELLAE